MVSRYICRAIVTLLLLCSAPAFAWDGVKGGKITGLDVTNAQNFGFRVYMDGTPMCGTTESWAYINKDWDNYQAMVSLLTSAYLAGKTVTIYTNKVGQNCEIGYVAMR